MTKEEKEEKEIIKRFHKYLQDLSASNNKNLGLMKPEKWNFFDESSSKWAVLAILSIQDDVKKDEELIEEYLKIKN